MKRLIFKIIIFASLLILTISSSSMADQWPFFKNDANRSSFTSTENLTPPLSTIWNGLLSNLTVSPEVRYSSPVIAGNKVFVGSTNGNVVAFDVAGQVNTGSNLFQPQLWTFQTEGPIYGSPAVAFVNPQLRLFAGSTDGNVYCLNPNEGSLIWKTNVGGAIFSSPVVSFAGSSQIVFIGSNNGSLYALNAQDGSIVWSYQTGSFIFASPAFDSNAGFVFIPSYDGFIYALNGQNGNLIWKKQFGPTRSTPSIANGVIYNVINHGEIFALDTLTGNTVFPTTFIPADTSAASSPAAIRQINRTVLLSAFNDNPSNQGILVAKGYNDNGTISTLWSFGFPDRVYSTPSVDAGSVYVGCDDGNLYVINEITGQLRQKILFGRPIQSSAAIANQAILITGDGVQLANLGMPPVRFQWAGPNQVVVGQTKTFTITAVDASGNIVPNYSQFVNVNFLSGGAILSPPGPVLIVGCNKSLSGFGVLA